MKQGAFFRLWLFLFSTVFVMCSLGNDGAFAAAKQEKAQPAKKEGAKSGAAGKPYVTTKVVGYSEKHGERVSGRVTIQPGFDRGRVLLDTVASNVRCAGNVNKAADGLDGKDKPDALWGRGMLSCADGTELLMQWWVHDDKIGMISAANNDGIQITAIYGIQKKAATQILSDVLKVTNPNSSYFGKSGSGKGGAKKTAETAQDKPGSSKKEGAPAAGKKPDKEDREGFGLGTGFFVSNNGILVTNWHVVEGASSVSVYLPHQRKGIPVEIIDRDPVNDVAVLKADMKSKGLPLFLGKVEKGEEIIVLGYPAVTLQGLEQKATFGRINALSGSKGDRRFYQIDAPLQPGNSGGPLLNRQGQVVGVVTATLSQEAAVKELGTIAQNVNYAVKTDYVNVLLRSLKEPFTPPEPRTAKLSMTELLKRLEDSVVLVLAE